LIEILSKFSKNIELKIKTLGLSQASN